MRFVVLLLCAALLLPASGCMSGKDKPRPLPLEERPGSGAPPATGTKVENPGAVILASGVRVTDEVIGNGPEARRGSVVLVHYTGTLADGKIFDQTNRKDAPARFILNTGPGGVIAGFVEGITGMRAGGVRVMNMPWALAYGDTRKGEIPAKSNLTFRVELMEVR